MPVNVSTTCDICGESARRYTSFFDLLGEDSMSYKAETVEVRGQPFSIFQQIHTPTVSTRGCLDPPGLFVCLCELHFAALVHAVSDWLSGDAGAHGVSGDGSGKK